mmetsp:Transcript_7702/g.47664  ORF Transcript_7702/g.47664 Transcript_7702/m.47664 type:complete len:86 (+) Transcript_7702:1560-1817(+)
MSLDLIRGSSWNGRWSMQNGWSPLLTKTLETRQDDPISMKPISLQKKCYCSLEQKRLRQVLQPAVVMASSNEKNAKSSNLDNFIF